MHDGMDGRIYLREALDLNLEDRLVSHFQTWVVLTMEQEDRHRLSVIRLQFALGLELAHPIVQ